MGHIFLSYSHDDKKEIDKLICSLESAGYKVWIDSEAIQFGQTWRKQIVEAIEESDVFILSLSHNSVKSDNLRKELDLASDVKKQILPVKLHHITIPRDMRYQLVGIQLIDLATDFDVGVSQLINVLKQMRPFDNVNGDDHGINYGESIIREERHIDATIPKNVVLNEEIELITMIRLSDKVGLTGVLKENGEFQAQPEDIKPKRFEIPFIFDESRNLNFLDLWIEIKTSDFKILEKRKKIRIELLKDSECCKFLLTPIKEGDIRLSVQVFLDKKLIASGLLKINGHTKLNEDTRIIKKLISLPIGVFAVRLRLEESIADKVKKPEPYLKPLVDNDEERKFPKKVTEVVNKKAVLPQSSDEKTKTEPIGQLPYKRESGKDKKHKSKKQQYAATQSTVKRRRKLLWLIPGIVVPLISAIVVFNIISQNHKTAVMVPERMVLIKGGCFDMGDILGGGDEDEKPVHKVCVDSFHIGKYEVTQGQWNEIMLENPSHFQNGDHYPVESISWYDIQVFLKKLKKLSGMNYRLPTEVEWEYAARAGTTTKRHCGDDEKCLASIAWYKDNSGGKTHPVGNKLPNSWDLCDMCGNVWEWVEDDWHDSYTDAPNDKKPWIDTPRGSERVIRGGGWHSLAEICRSSNRYPQVPSYVHDGLGFRLVLPQAISKEQQVSEPESNQEGIKITTSVIYKTKFRTVSNVNLTEESVKKMLKQHNFFCMETELSKEYCNDDGSAFDNKFEKKNSGQVVYDQASDLMWQQSGSDKYMIYEKAKSYIRKLNSDQFAGYNDWRLPTLEEAMSLMEPTKNNGDLYINPVFDKIQKNIWTSDLNSASGAWVVDFNGGNCDGSAYNFSGHVRAVRSVQ